MPETTHDIAALFATVFRDFVDDGVIASGPYQPEKLRLRQLGDAIAAVLAEKASKDLATAEAAGLLSPQQAAKLAGIDEKADKYEHPTADGSRHLPPTGAGDVARWLKSGSAAGAMAQWDVISKADIGLGQADNTPDAEKPVSDPQQLALNEKADKAVKIMTGDGLSGGGDLSGNREIALNAASIASLALADSAVQSDGLGDLATVDYPETPIGYVLNDMGEWVPPGASGGGGGESLVQIDTFTASGIYTKPAWARVVDIFIIGGGGGGASGEKKAPGTVSRGGSSGAGGCLAFASFLSSSIALNEIVSVGAGGAGGVSATNNDSTYLLGTSGGDSIFGEILFAVGGPPAHASGPGTAKEGMFKGATGGGGGATGGAGAQPATPPAGAGGGGGGGGITTANVASRGAFGGAAGAAWAGTPFATRGEIGERGGDAFPRSSEDWRPSGGGAGGGSSITGDAGDGGEGRNGGGGGGGGAARNDVGNSGAGGNGGDGIIVVITRG